ncbi:MAG: CARDB domain-containing protein [Methylococcales bacterium]|nr:CARDB domain-containing protein [Methylococcales bacterium]
MKKNKNTFNRLMIGFTTALLLATTGVHAGQTTRVSVSSAGTQADCSYITEYGCSFTDAISADGRYVVFSSYAGGLVAGYGSLYVRDRVTGKTTRVNGVSNNAFEIFDTSAISANGRYIVFSSKVNNLVPGDTNDALDIFVRDLVTGTTSRVSVSSKGEQGNDYSFKPAISADGRYVAFRSWADNLVDGDTNGNTDVFVRDRMTGKTTRVNVSSTGVQGYGNDEGDYFNDFRSRIAISADGRYVAFSTNANNLVTGDTNGIDDVFVRDCVNHTTTRVSVGLAGVQGNSYSREPAISADGRYVAFESAANNLIVGDTNRTWDVFVRDRTLNTTTRVSVSSVGTQANSNYGSSTSAISADGRYVAFSSDANNLVAGDTNGTADVFVRDRTTNTTSRVSVSSAGVQGNYGYLGSGIWGLAISVDGRFVVFDSYATNLVAGDTNNAPDIFVRDRLLNTSYVADLQATVTAKPASVKKGQTASFKLTVKNNGPDSAGNVALTDIVSNGTVLSIIPSQGASCSKAAISVCRLGSLAAGASASVAVNIRAEACSLTQQLSVSATPKDNAPSNNAVRVITPVIIP